MRGHLSHLLMLATRFSEVLLICGLGDARCRRGCVLSPPIVRDWRSLVKSHTRNGGGAQLPSLSQDGAPQKLFEGLFC